MKKWPFLLILLFYIGTVSSCKNKTHRSSHNNLSSYETEYNEDGYNEDGYNDNGYDENGKDEYGHIQDGIYSASVDYYNPSTGYSATYTLDVAVKDGEVTVIYFPNDGYLDDDHIFPSELDDDGYVEIEGEEGKTYEIQIDL